MRPPWHRVLPCACLAVFLLVGSGCRTTSTPLPSSSPVELRIGVGLSRGESAAIVDQIVQIVGTEALVTVGRDGRYQPWLAQSIEVRDNGLVWRITLRDGVRFHDGTNVDADTIKTLLASQFRQMGTLFGDVTNIVAVGPTQIDITLRERSTLLIEGLSSAILRPGSQDVGVGPFTRVSSSGNSTVLKANDSYYGGRSTIAEVSIRTYDTVRAAWAEMLRGNIDMLYEVGGEALDSLEPSSRTRVYTFSRPYAYVGILNTRRGALKDPAIRRALTAAIDHQRFVREGLNGHGQPATGPVSPYHWANTAPSATPYTPHRLTSPLTIHCLYVEPADERLALIVKRMLEDIGSTVTLEQVSPQVSVQRMQSGDFDIVLGDVIQGPGLLRPLLFWGTGEQLNWAQYSNASVDAAFSAIRSAANDDEYKAGVTALQQAMLDDPPAIFLAWRERARAVSARFDVPVEPGRDILRTLRLWKPTGGAFPTN